jgi:hypothetical protein
MLTSILYLAGHGALNNDNTVLIVGARPPQNYICKYIKDKIAKL